MIIPDFDYKAMKRICLSPEADFAKLEGFTATETVDGTYLFKSGGDDCKVLAVAHLDSVAHAYHFFHMNNPLHDRVYCPTLDDRLGVYLITEYIPKTLGLQVDILLTTGEETGRSTAAYFETTKQYNWMFQFDRMGNDVVMYQYRTQKLENRLRAAGFKKFDPGMFSDICFLDHLKCLGINFGTCYHDYHSVLAWADMRDLKQQLVKFQDFYKKFADKKMPYDGGGRSRIGGGMRHFGSFAEWTDYYSDYPDYNQRFYSGGTVSKKVGNPNIVTPARTGRTLAHKTDTVYIGFKCIDCGGHMTPQWPGDTICMDCIENRMKNRVCVVCGTRTELNMDELCSRCSSQVHSNSLQLCVKCGLHKFDVENQMCPECKEMFECPCLTMQSPQCGGVCSHFDGDIECTFCHDTNFLDMAKWDN